MNISFWDAFFGLSLGDGDENRYIDEMKRFFPIQNQLWGVKQPVWVDTSEAWKLFCEIPELRAVINKRASMMSTNKPLLINEATGEEVTTHWFNDILKAPNPTQSWSDIVYSIGVQDALYSNTFIYAPVRSFNIRNLFVPLPSNKVQINLSGRKLKQMDKEGLITNYVFRYDDQTRETLETKDVIYLTTSDGMNIVKPTSRIESLKFPLSNIKAQYHKRNVLLENIGAIGIMSAKKSDIGGAIPMTPEEKKRIQKDWYNRQKDEIIITEAELDWKPMSYPTKDLMLFEELTEDKIALLDCFGLNSNIFSSVKGSTYSNVRDSIRMVYTDTIIPETQTMYDSIAEQCGLKKEGLKLIAKFDHLPILQDDHSQEALTMKTRAEALEKILAMNVTLSEDEIRMIVGI